MFLTMETRFRKVSE